MSPDRETWEPTHTLLLIEPEWEQEMSSYIGLDPCGHLAENFGLWDCNFPYLYRLMAERIDILVPQRPCISEDINCINNIIVRNLWFLVLSLHLVQISNLNLKGLLCSLVHPLQDTLSIYKDPSWWLVHFPWEILWQFTYQFICSCHCLVLLT